MNKHPHKRKSILLLFVLASVALSGCLAGEAEPAFGDDKTDSMSLEAVPLLTHIQFGVFEQDVFIERPGQDGVYRVTPADADLLHLMDKPLYSTADAVPHDPTFTFEGPFDKGADLAVTAGQWLSAQGAFAYHCQGGVAGLHGSFAGLVPDGVYTVWYARLTMDQGAITDAVDLPAGATDGSQNTFHAASDGTGDILIDAFPCVEPTSLDADGTGTATVWAIAWHSDQQTYGAHPGDFGSKTHVQLFAIADA